MGQWKVINICVYDVKKRSSQNQKDVTFLSDGCLTIRKKGKEEREVDIHRKADFREVMWEGLGYSSISIM